MKHSDWEWRREGVLNGWTYQLLNRETTIEEQLGKWTFAITMRGEPYIAHVLVKSFDYYEQRLHLRRDERPITLLVCQQHTTCVPVRVEVLSFPGSYEPYQLPVAYLRANRGTVLGKQVLLGQLLSGAIDQTQAFADVARSTRFLYLARMKHLLKPAPGRRPSL